MTIPDRRETLEAALEASEQLAEAAQTTPVAEVTEVQEVTPAAVEPTPKPEVAPPPTAEVEEVVEKPVGNLERPPQAWKPAQKAKWASLDPEIRSEVLRREKETTRVLNDSAQARQFSNEFIQTVSPFLARIQANNLAPMQAVHELLKADHILSTAPPPQKAQFMAKLINDYGINIEQLDLALSGKPQVDPVESRVEQLLQQRLAPFQQYMQQQQQLKQQQEQVTTQQLAETVESLATDPQFPYFEQVRDTMADIIELTAKRGQTISIETAYNRAIAVDPDISSKLASSSQARAQASQAAILNSKAQKALQASVSVTGAPNSPGLGTSNASNRRSVIAAAMEAAGGR